MEDQFFFVKHMIFVIWACRLVAQILEIHFSTSLVIIIISDILAHTLPDNPRIIELTKKYWMLNYSAFTVGDGLT